MINGKKNKLCLEDSILNMLEKDLFKPKIKTSLNQLINMIKKFQQFGSDVKYEMSKVSWPDWDDLKSSTYVVLILSLILTLFLFVVDVFLSKTISTIM